MSTFSQIILGVFFFFVFVEGSHLIEDVTIAKRKCALKILQQTYKYVPM